MALIRMEDGDHINTENVVKFTKLRGNSYKFLDVTGAVHCGATYEPEEKFWPILPAAAGYTSVIEVEDTWVLRPVVGWRLCPGGNFAIMEGSGDDHYYSAIIQPDGSVIDTDGNPFKDLASYQSAASEQEIADAA